MTSTVSLVPASAYMLADHLDAALASGEDILAAGRNVVETADVGQYQPVALRSSVELIRALELALITRVLKAREWSQALVKTDVRFKLTAQLFMAGTVALVDAIAEFADATQADFETGDGVTAYFRSRGMIDAEAATLSTTGAPLVNEAFLVTGRIELGPLMDLIAAYLDSMEVHFLLFGGSAPPLHAGSDLTLASQNVGV
jgi:hypothetical protein